jgi:hypothetical protein
LMAARSWNGGGQCYGTIDGGAEAEASTQPFPMQATESAQETKRPWSMTRGPLGGRRRTHADIVVSPRRRKSHPNLGCICVAANSAAKMRRAAGLGFSGPDQKWTDSDAHGSFVSGR